jgi:TctA family transporter
LVSVLLLFGALAGGATFMGSITAILFNIPGTSSAAAAMPDGHPRVRAGRPRTAIACAATASASGSVFGALVLLAVLPPVVPLVGLAPALAPFTLGVGRGGSVKA